MAKGAYIGVGGKARKIRKGYIGVNTDVPVYDTSTTAITASNISNFFNVVNSPYYFAGSGNTFTSNNKGVNSSTAATLLGALVDMELSFTYSYSSEKDYDKFTLKVGSTAVEDAVSGSTTTKTWSGSVKKGDVIQFTYVKDNSNHGYNDVCTFSNMNVTTNIQTGTVMKSVARKIKKAYIGVNGIARLMYYSPDIIDLGSLFSGMTIIESGGRDASTKNRLRLNLTDYLSNADNGSYFYLFNIIAGNLSIRKMLVSNGSVSALDELYSSYHNSSYDMGITIDGNFIYSIEEVYGGTMFAAQFQESDSDVDMTLQSMTTVQSTGRNSSSTNWVRLTSINFLPTDIIFAVNESSIAIDQFDGNTVTKINGSHSNSTYDNLYYDESTGYLYLVDQDYSDTNEYYNAGSIIVVRGV